MFVDNYKDFIGKRVSVKVHYFRHTIQGVLVAVYSDVIVLQGMTMWGVQIRDIVAFEIHDEQLGLQL